MVTLNRPPINPPVPSGNQGLPHSHNLGPPDSGNLLLPHSHNLGPPHSGNLVPPMANRSNSNSSYVKMNSAAVDKETLYEKAERNEPLYDEVGRPQSFNEYSKPEKGCTNTDN